MFDLFVAVVFALNGAQGTVPDAQVIQPSVDSAEQRASLRSLSMCLAKARPRWARQILAHPYLSKEQASMATMALAGRDTCIRGPEAEVIIRTSGLVGSIAEHFIAASGAGVDMEAVAKALNKVSALNASEDFALCVAARNPAASRDLAMSVPGTDGETRAVQQVAAAIKPCLNPAEPATVDLQSLRALVSIALYRGMTTAAGA